MGHRADRNETLERGFESGAVYFISHITSFFHPLGAPLLPGKLMSQFPELPPRKTRESTELKMYFISVQK